MDNEKLMEKVFALEGEVREIKVIQKQQSKDMKEIKDMLKTFQKDKEDDVKWVKRQFMSIGIGVIMMIFGLGIGCYSMKQIQDAKTIIQQYEK